MIRKTTWIGFALLATACADSPTGNQRRTAPSFGRAGSSGPAIHLAGERYQDSGAHPATGRSGSAAIQAEALAAENGATTLTVTSHRAADLSVNAGNLARVHVKAFDASGRLLFTRTFNGTSGNMFTTSFAGLAPGTRFQVQANVTGIDRRRTDVVTAGPSAHRGPDLAVTAVAAPANVVINTPVIISATVAELNGERGAKADCILEIDGAVVDRAPGVWVDAGDAVSCVFTTSFAVTGTRSVRVHVNHVRPRDFDQSNNTGSTTLVVSEPAAGPGPSVLFGGEIRDVLFARRDTFSTRWTYSDGRLFLESVSTTDSSGREQRALISGTLQGEITFPITRLDVAQTSGGVLLHQARYDDVQPDSSTGSGASCAARGVGTGVETYVCSQQAGFTTVTYLRAAGTVTFRSLEYSKVWNGESYDESTWVDNGNSSVGELLPWGADFTFNVVLTDGGRIFTIAATALLLPVDEVEDEPLVCTNSQFEIPPDLFDIASCFGSFTSRTGVAGTLAGVGFVTTP